MIFRLIIKGPLSIEVLFSKKSIDFGESQKLNLSQDLLWDFTQENIEDVFKKIIDIDGVVARKFDRDGSFKWDIDISNYPHISNRFRCLIPRICKSRNLDGVLYPFQKEGKDWLLKSKVRILADDMGLGKSIQSIAAIEEGIYKRQLDKVLLVCPNTLVTNWESELRKWCPLLSYFSVNSSNVGDKIFLKK